MAKRTATPTGPAGDLKVGEAALALGVSRRTVYYLVNSGELAAIRHWTRGGTGRGAIRIEPSAIAAYKARHKAANGGAA